jgi:hypothetical protein
MERDKSRDTSAIGWSNKLRAGKNYCIADMVHDAVLQDEYGPFTLIPQRSRSRH